MEYNSIHDYLDAVFKADANPTKEEVIEAKKRYYRLWHREYNRKRRKFRKEFTLGFAPDALRRIKDQKGDMSVSKFLYRTIFDRLGLGVTSSYDREQLTIIHQKLMQLMALLEENGDSPQIEDILDRIEELELRFSKLIV